MQNNCIYLKQKSCFLIKILLLNKGLLQMHWYYLFIFLIYLFILPDTHKLIIFFHVAVTELFS